MKHKTKKCDASTSIFFWGERYCSMLIFSSKYPALENFFQSESKKSVELPFRGLKPSVNLDKKAFPNHVKVNQGDC